MCWKERTKFFRSKSTFPRKSNWFIKYTFKSRSLHVSLSLSTYCIFKLSALLQLSFVCSSLIHPSGNVSIRWLIVSGDFLVRTNFHEYREDKRGCHRVNVHVRRTTRLIGGGARSHACSNFDVSLTGGRDPLRSSLVVTVVRESCSQKSRVIITPGNQIGGCF